MSRPPSRRCRRILSLLALIAAVLPATGSSATEPASPEGTSAAAEGKWWGTLVTPQESVELGLHLARRDAKGGLVVAITQPSANYFETPVGGASVDDGGRLSVPALEFEATLEGDRLIGTLGRLRVPFELRRVAELPAQPAVPDLPTGPAPLWQTRLNGQVYASPAVMDGVAYVGTTGGVFHAVNAADGRLVWTFAAGAPILGTARLTADAVYFVSDGGYLFKVARATGKEVWRYDLGDVRVPRILPHPAVFEWDWHAPRPLVVDGTVFVGAGDGGFHAVGAETGERRWRAETGGKVRGGAALVAESVVVGSADHFLYSFARSTGREIWKHDTGAAIEDEPLAADGRLFVGNRGRGLLALAAATGEELWRTSFWGSWIESTPTLVDGVLYIGSSDLSRVSALDPDDGRVLWRSNVFGWTFGTPLVLADRILAGAAGGTPYFIPHVAGLTRLDRATGTVVARWPLGDPGASHQWGIAGSLALAGDIVVATTVDGSIFGFPVD